MHQPSITPDILALVERLADATEAGRFAATEDGGWANDPHPDGAPERREGCFRLFLRAGRVRVGHSGRTPSRLQVQDSLGRVVADWSPCSEPEHAALRRLWGLAAKAAGYQREVLAGLLAELAPAPEARP
jgi:hypothetical protein